MHSTAQKGAVILLGTFLLSVSLIPSIELGHNLLHSVRNPLHYHETHARRSATTHSLVDHHFQKMKFADEMNESQSEDCFIALAYGFCQSLVQTKPFLNADILTHRTDVRDSPYVVDSPPPTPPPLSGTLS